ncbi:MAG: hypothetical protein ACPGVB_00570, partial [Chitinophagales bacterium]
SKLFKMSTVNLIQEALDFEKNHKSFRTRNEKILASGKGILSSFFSKIDSTNFPKDLLVEFYEDERIENIFYLSSCERTKKEIIFEYGCSTDDLIESHENKWAPLAFYSELKKETLIDSRITVELYDIDKGQIFNSCASIYVCLPLKGKLGHLLKEGNLVIEKLLRRIEISLGNLRWKNEFHSNEKLFSLEIVLPLLRKMNFISIHYNHGRKEYGKDFTFKELDKFGQVKNYGLQVKAGDISRKVNSAIDEIIGQIDDAFTMPYYDTNSKNPQYISTFIVAISGKYTENAKEKIMYKISKGVIGSVYFLDKEMILELIERYWVSKK